MKLPAQVEMRPNARSMRPQGWLTLKVRLAVLSAEQCSLATTFKTYIKVPMLFKRNQVEEAIFALLEPDESEPSSQLRTRLKRLLETDRSLGRNTRSLDPARANYAFYGDEPPGSGVEVWFSGYECFALLNGLQLMQHGWSQTFAVSVLRRVRPDLEKEHARILKRDRKVLFDEAKIRQSAKAGDAAFNTTDPVLLTIVSAHGQTIEQQDLPVACAVHRGTDPAMRWVMKITEGIGGGSSMFEQTSIAFALADRLERTEPQLRGRTS
jgi:hypothetical protein